MDQNTTQISREYEYEIQFFGFTPDSFVNGVYNAVNDYVVDCFQELENLVKSEPSLSGNVNQEQLHEESDKMANNFYKSIDEAFDRFEIYVKKNILKIPPHVLLPEDKVHHDKLYTVEDEKKVDKEIEELERKIKAAKYVNTALKQEVKDLDNAQEQLDNFGKQMDVIQKASEGLKESLAVTFEEVKKVHEMISDGLSAGTLQVQTSADGNWPKDSKKKKIKLG
ncbi:unnamed protein product [Porites evermanni]|uniref:Protein MIS12 homolog n=1 Tax=Porites evermanni TaxID=104178 RepID=A0ABN8ME85_9CNID|nr:unnamed protein product [Porites evermanni]